MLSSGVKTLLGNTKDDLAMASSVLLRISGNILNNASNEKYRSIRIDSQTFQNKLLPCEGAIQCLLEMGFQEDNDRFTLFMESNLNDLKEIHDQLLSVVSTSQKPSMELITSQNKILARLKSHFQHGRIYENKTLQEKARSVIPVTQLNEQAKRRLTRTSKSGVPQSYHHCLILELLAWFKKSFFTWTDAPKCNYCDSKLKPHSIGMLPPSQEDLLWGASRVEGYQCSCGKTLRFPRYNHPEKLLQTRTGRCGEWANCFTLICRSMGFEARHVMDWTDHVWTEVYIPQWQRWVHCDPCENACDRPLVYEQGWKKKLSLIVAASAEEIVDVTWRYSVNRDEVNLRRWSMFGEEWLVDELEKLNSSLSIAVEPARKKELQKRRESEKLEFEKTKKISSDEYGGRTSGSLSWRLARGETHGSDVTETTMNEYARIELTSLELESCLFHIEYSCSFDEYTRVSNKSEKLIGWESLVYKSRDIMRKEELDWNQAYLCRNEGSRDAYISWSISIPAMYHIAAMCMLVRGKTFESGSVKWLLCSDKKSDVLTSDKAFTASDRYKDASILSVHAFLGGGQGENAWQKSQLFREPTTHSVPPSLVFKIKLQKS